MVSDIEDIACPSIYEADDEGEDKDTSHQLDFHGIQDQKLGFHGIPPQIESLVIASDLQQSSISCNDLLSLPWHEDSASNQKLSILLQLFLLLNGQSLFMV